MPLIENIPVRKYQEGDPYNHVVDNQPLQDLQQQISLVNYQVENDRRAISDAVGSQGSLASRLARSTDSDGSLKSEAIDDALHHVSEHLDGNGFVRMTDAERSKLDGIDSEATDLKIQVEAISTIPLYDGGTVTFRPSDSLVWRVSGTNVYADVAFPLTARHAHSYDIEAVPVTPISPDYTNYKVTSIATPYKQGTLRVFVNGVRLSKNATIPVPRGSGSSATWLNLSYTEATATGGIVTSGRFTLTTAVTSSDQVMVDFDTAINV